MKYLLTLLAVILLTPAGVSAASIKCTALSSDLSQGSSGSSVLSLQNYLQLSGHLAATPNGVFGPATLAAVKKFQTANGIPATGTVGPITRLAIQVKSCQEVRMDPIPSTPAAPAVDSSKPRSAVSITAPWEGTTLTLGKVSTIRWGDSMSLSDALVLDADDGTAKGYIAFFPGTGGEYAWDVGKVSVGDATETVEPGKYRIRVQDKLRGAAANDPKSGLFTIAAPDLAVSSVSPSSMLADGKASAVLFGSGFTKSTRVYLDGLYENAANVLFVSPDGNLLVFSIPQGVSRGLHRIVLRNSYGTIDNTLSLRVN